MHVCLGPPDLALPNGISIGSTMFCWAHERDQQTDTNIHTQTQTDHAPSAAIARILCNSCDAA